MRIPCPYCGERDVHEFVYRGDAAPVRPTSDEGFYDYVYLRDNFAGAMREHWYHAQALEVHNGLAGARPSGIVYNGR